MSEREREAAEQGRQEAEADRQEHEHLRRTAEGGPADPDELELGRVEAEERRESAEMVRIEAEQVRVIAETRRGSLQKTYLKVAGIVAFPLAFIALIPSTVGFVLVDRAREENCREIEALKASERAEALSRYRELARSLKLLGISHSPEIEAVARERRDATLKRFPSRKC